jgi:P4 family phage/plasmid primase-like protien
MAAPDALKVFMSSRRVKDASEHNIVGMGKGDTGKYHVSEDDYDTFLGVLYNHIFGSPPRASSLLERHREVGPLLIDLDFRYESGGPLIRRYTAAHVKSFIAHYVAAMFYFAKMEDCGLDELVFYHLEKPSPETDKTQHKDGIHIQCHSLTTSPKLQFGIRGFMLEQKVIEKIFGETGVSNPTDDIYDVSVISRNNWFLYGACKPDKAQYKIVNVWKVSLSSIADVLEGSPADFNELADIINDVDEGHMTPAPAPPTSLEMVKTMSIRRNHKVATPLSLPRSDKVSEWEELMIHWGSGKGKMERAPPPVRNTIELEDTETALVASDDMLEECRRVTSARTAEDISQAYRLARECLNADRRAGDYHDWINLAICLKNIANTDESFKVWCDVTRRVDPSHKKARYTDTELRTKWNLVRVDETKKLNYGSLQHWAKEDNSDKHRSILSETYTSWLINFAKDTHVSVASFVFKMYEHDFRCSVGSRKGQQEWYNYPPHGHSWKAMRTNTELRARLSGMVKNEYVNAGIQLGKLHNSDENKDNSAERERLDDKRKKLMGIERQLEMRGFKDHIMKECEEKFYDDEFINRLNSNPYLLGVANGVLELRRYPGDEGVGRPHVYFRPGQPDDNISFQMGRSDPDMEPTPYVEWKDIAPDMQAELMAFFERIYPDPVLRTYVLTLLSSCLEGCNKEQKFYVMQGVGSNGKSMIEKLMEWTFGDYGTSLGTQVFTRKRPDSGQANADIITIKCRRYIHMGEPDDNEKINTSIMKQYSGGDAVHARGLFSDQEKFSIMGKIFMSCNDLPPVSKMDGGTWRRIRVIPHVSVFKDPGDASINPSRNIYPKDLDLENKLRHWRTAFLSLLVHYYDTRYLAHGLSEPDCVTSASNRYKEENDTFMQFFNDCFVKEAGAGCIKSQVVREIFNEWKKHNAKNCDLKPQLVCERMKDVCGNGSTDKEFWGVRRVDPVELTDLSGGGGGAELLSHMP